MDNLETPPTHQLQAQSWKFWFAAVAILLAAVLVTVYFFFPQILPWQAKVSSPEEPYAKAITVLAKDFSFTPSTIYVLPGQSVEIMLVNLGKEMHNLTIEELGVATLTTKPGERSPVLRFTAPADPGEYPLHITCRMPGHKEAGMTAIIAVEGR